MDELEQSLAALATVSARRLESNEQQGDDCLRPSLTGLNVALEVQGIDNKRNLSWAARATVCTRQGENGGSIVSEILSANIYGMLMFRS